MKALVERHKMECAIRSLPYFSFRDDVYIASILKAEDRSAATRKKKVRSICEVLLLIHCVLNEAGILVWQKLPIRL